jgi:hypothetical protein
MSATKERTREVFEHENDFQEVATSESELFYSIFLLVVWEQTHSVFETAFETAFALYLESIPHDLLVVWWRRHSVFFFLSLRFLSELLFLEGDSQREQSFRHE